MSPNNASSGKSNEVISTRSSEAEVRGAPEGTQDRGRGTVRSLMGELLGDIYHRPEAKRRASVCGLLWRCSGRDGSSGDIHAILELMSKDVELLKLEKRKLEKRISDEGHQLVRQLKKKNFLLTKRDAHCDLITAYIQAVSSKTREDTKMKFSLSPGAETTGFSQWLDAMKMVAQLPGGMPSEFRTKLWLQLSEKHLNDQRVDWEKAETVIFNSWTNPDDEELGVQIVKDLHRTGCSLFCGEQEQNQALLKRVLLAYARWNKTVGYCQGFNMLAALILQVMNKDEKNAVKVMIYLIEGVLPESYFANNLRGLSVDMAVFRDLLRLRLPKLSKHLEALQHDTNSGTSYEPPLTNVFTMQWFLTLFSNCLPQQTVLRVWDLVFLYGNEILLRTALAIWAILQDRVISVESADEFYSIMGVVTREMLEFGLMDANALVKRIAMVDPFPNELQELREKYLYNISPWTQSVHCAAKKGIKLFYSDAEEQDDTEDEDKIALTTAYGVFRRRESSGRELQVSGPTLDIGILKQQYAKLRQRQRQAHVIITAACSSNLRNNIGPSPSVSVNHLLMGKSALVNKGRRIGPPEGSIPPTHNAKGKSKESQRAGRLRQDSCHWKDIEKFRSEGRGKNTKEEKKMTENEESNEDRRRDKNEDAKNMNTEGEEEEEEGGGKGGGGGGGGDDGNGSSSSTELCDSEDSNSFEEGLCPFDLSENSCPEPAVEIPKENKNSDEHEFESNENSGCDNSILLEIKTLTVKSVDDLEANRVPKSIKLETESETDSKDSFIERNSNTEVQIKRYDNTNNIVSPTEDADIFRFDNTFKIKPEVPINRNDVMENSPEEGERVQSGSSTDSQKISQSQNVALRKSDLGLNIIRENLQMLHKFSAKGVSGTKIRQTIDENEGNQEREEEKVIEKKTSFNRESKKENLSEVEEILLTGQSFGEGFEKVFEFEQRVRCASPIVQKCNDVDKGWIFGSKIQEDAKESNAEIRFGWEDINSCRERRGKSEEGSLLTGGTCRARFMQDEKEEVDEIKAKIEISKNDWDVKMKRIAELETTTREALDDMLTRSGVHKSPKSLTSSSGGRVVDVLEVRPSARFSWNGGSPKAPTTAEPDMENLFFGRTPKATRSFDAITSRTEKLLGHALHERHPMDDSFSSFSNDKFNRNRKLAGSDSVSGRTLNRTDSEESDFRFTETAFRHRLSFLTRSKPTDSDSEGKTKKRGDLGMLERKEVDSPQEKQKFNPFPTRTQPRPKELGMKLGLYPTSPDAASKKF